MREWYVVITKYAEEDRAERELRNQLFHVFNPKSRVNHTTKSGKTSLKVMPTFPGYVFVRFDKDKTRWQVINNTFGCKSIYTCDEVPLRVRRGVIESIISSAASGFVQDDYVAEVIRKMFEVGDEVEIASGAFAKLKAKIVGMTSQEKIDLMLDVFGRPTKTTVSASALV